MKYAKILGVVGLCGAFLLLPAAPAQAQHVSVGIGIGVGPTYVAPVGPPPVCAYGYYRYYPYACAPYGYYGPAWFVNGVFIGADPWYGWGWNHGYWRHGYGGHPSFYGHGYYGHGGFNYGFHGGVHEFHGGGGFYRGGHR
jgi:hypothetical protein